MTATRDLSRLEPIEKAGRDELQALQLKRLQWSLHHAYENVGFYRKKFAEHGVHPGDLRTLDDLRRFPFTSKQDLRDNYPFGMFAVPREQVVRLHASSGTTGKPTVVGYTRQDIDMWADVVARSLRAAGVHPGDICQISYGYGLFTGGLGAHYGAERLGCTVIPMSGGQTEKQVQLILDFRPRGIMVTPSYCLCIADELERQGMDPAATSLDIGIFGAEPWTEEMRRELEQRMGLTALDIYGLSEVIGSGVAAECIETKDGLTVWEDFFYPEIIDPDTREVLADEERGELVFTSLTKEAMPIIRYRTRDLTRLLPGTARTMRRMEKVTGRTDDMLIIRGVNIFPSQIEEQILRVKTLAPHYQIEVSRAGNLDEMNIIVELKPGMEACMKDAAATELMRHVKEMIGVSTGISVQDPGTVTRSQGKAQRVIDKRKLG